MTIAELDGAYAYGIQTKVNLYTVWCIWE